MMNAAPAPDSLPPALLDLLLQRAPVDVLLLDTTLVCRYAAPTGSQFFGHPPDQLVGRHVAEIFPPAADGLRPVLERVAQGADPWHVPRYQFRCAVGGVETAFCLAVRVEPVRTADYQGVLLVLVDAEELRQLTDELGQLQAQVRRLRQTVQELRTTVRARLTPVVGYLQLLVRRPARLEPHPPAEVLRARVLPQLEALVATVDQLSTTLDPDADDEPRLRPHRRRRPP